MSVPRIYLPLPLATNTVVDLDERARRHVAQVLRKKPGDALVLFNGEGGEFRATLVSMAKRRASVRVDEFHAIERESALTTCLGLGISKGDRMDYALQKAVELGVSEIVPLYTEHCVVRLDEARERKKRAHWQAVVVSACEQCGRNRVPEVGAPLDFARWLALPRGTRLILEPGADPIPPDVEPGETVTLAVGPEGGFSVAEVDQARAADFIPVRLGPRVLRTETAAVAALAAIQSRWGDL